MAFYFESLPFYILVVLVLTLAATLVEYLFLRRWHTKRKAFFSRHFGIEKYAEPSLPKEVDRYYRYLKKTCPRQRWVDETTWHDLGMDEVFAALNNCLTSPGEEAFFAALHQNAMVSKDENEAFDTLTTFFSANPAVRLALQVQLDLMGKSPSASLVDLFEYPQLYTPYRPKLTRLMGCLPLAALLLIKLSPVAAAVFFRSGLSC